MIDCIAQFADLVDWYLIDIGKFRHAVASLIGSHIERYRHLGDGLCEFRQVFARHAQLTA